MSKKNGGGDGFRNRAARKFKDMQLRKVDQLDQSEIYEILDEDMGFILTQMQDFQEHKYGAKYPTYVANMFANISTAKYFHDYTEKLIKKKKKGKIDAADAKAQIKALKHIIADVYKKSATNQYPDQSQEFIRRNKLLSTTFMMLDAKNYKRTKQLKLDDDAQRRDLIIQVYGDPVHNMRFVHKHFNQSNLSEKKKMKLLKEMYGKRFVAAAGAAMTVDSNGSDFLEMLFKHITGLKTRKRAPYVRAFAEAYKVTKGTKYYHINDEFFEDNRKLIKELIKHVDLGYEKAFNNSKPSSKPHKNKDKGIIKDKGIAVYPDFRVF